VGRDVWGEVCWLRGVGEACVWRGSERECEKGDGRREKGMIMIMIMIIEMEMKGE
jgi:hypothetical protein